MKDCETCEHEDLPGGYPPCRDCNASDNWTPKRDRAPTPDASCSTWTFVSSAAAFDGARIVREAMWDGLALIEITTRSNITLIMWTDEFDNRLVNARVQPGHQRFASGRAPTIGANLHLKHQDWSLSKYSHVMQGLPGRAAKMHAALLAAEASRGARTTIAGFK